MYKINKSNLLISTTLRGFIDGSLLSDGNIHFTKGSNNTACFRHTSTEYGYLLYIRNKLEIFGVDCFIDEDKRRIAVFSNGSFVAREVYNLRTRYYKEFMDMRNRWYKEYYFEDADGYECLTYKKYIPRDIVLTDDCVAGWYVGDGSITKDKRWKSVYTIELSTCGFIKDDVEFICNLLNHTVGINSYVCSDNDISVTGKHDVTAFLEYVVDLVPECYDYKIPKELVCR